MNAFILIFSSVVAFAQTESKIENFYSVDPSGLVFRGREPKTEVSELKKKGITDVIIFKNDLGNEVKNEKQALKKLGINSYHIPFKWKDIDFQEACGQTVKALQDIEKLTAKNKRVYFHCSVGEDRTGLLAGLWRIYSQDWSAKKAFTDEMCARGYSNGDKEKPAQVTHAIEAGLTPLFEAMSAKLIEKKSLEGICKGIKLQKSELRCK